MNNLDLTFYKICDFFDMIEDITNEYIDEVELEPIWLEDSLYLTGLSRSINNHVKLHLKEIKHLKLNTQNGDEWYSLEPNGEIWLSTTLITESMLKAMFEKFLEAFNKLPSFHLMTAKYQENETYYRTEARVYKTKRIACKEALKFRKEHQNASIKFKEFNANGTEVEKEPSDFELVTAAVE